MTITRRISVVCIWLGVVLLPVACASPGRSSPTAPGAATPSPTLVGNATASPRTAAPGEFKNPVLATDFPDPFVLKVGTTYWAYATEGNAQHIQVARSNDLVTWQTAADALPQIPRWSTGRTWAPEVAQTSAGFVMYYTLNAYDLQTPRGEGAQCVSFATSRTPEGPFVDPNTKPLVCQPELGGSIDASPFRDRDGKRYLIWKNDGNCCDIPTRFYIQQLSADGRALMGRPRDMGVVNDAEWETLVNSRIEAPELLLHEGTYYLFFSGSAHDTEFYAVGYATSKTVTGPYVDAPENPILETRQPAIGPGHNSFTQAPDGNIWTLYHAWNPEMTFREMWLDELVFENGKAVVKGPDVGPQPAPKAAP